jgi:hypothetical protein
VACRITGNAILDIFSLIHPNIVNVHATWELEVCEVWLLEPSYKHNMSNAGKSEMLQNGNERDKPKFIIIY